MRRASRSTASATLVHVTLEDYQRPVAAGVTCKVEFVDGEIRMDEHRPAFSVLRIQAAAELGIDLTGEQAKAVGPAP